MSKVKIQGNASGTGVVTLTAPNTNTDRIITLPDETVSLTGAPVGLDDVSGVARATSGLLFNGDTAAANTLDDYEEGTWTPGISFGGGVVGVTYQDFLGKYTKVGNLVTASGFFQLTAKGTSTGVAIITGLPFTSANITRNYAAASIRTKGVSFADNVMAHNSLNTTTLELFESTNAGVVSQIYDTNFENTSNIMINVSYKVA